MTASSPKASYAEPNSAGYRAIVVTLDTWTTRMAAQGPQHRKTSPSCVVSAGELLHRRRLPEAPFKEPPQADLKAATVEWIKVWGNSLQWADLTWLRSLTKLPMLLKGICHPDDVRRAKDYGIDGIYCSNHGGRQANGGLPALDALPDVVTAADGMPVLFDSGVRSGSDVAKALAMGATAVGVGRPYVYALAVGGTDGVVSQLRSLLAELDLLMAIDGLPTVADLLAAGVRRLSGALVGCAILTSPAAKDRIAGVKSSLVMTSWWEA